MWLTPWSDLIRWLSALTPKKLASKDWVSQFESRIGFLIYFDTFSGRWLSRNRLLWAWDYAGIIPRLQFKEPWEYPFGILCLILTFLILSLVVFIISSVCLSAFPAPLSRFNASEARKEYSSGDKSDRENELIHSIRICFTSSSLCELYIPAEDIKALRDCHGLPGIPVGIISRLWGPLTLLARKMEVWLHQFIRSSACLL